MAKHCSLWLFCSSCHNDSTIICELTVPFYSRWISLLSVQFLVKVPESPMWLLSKQRDETALKSLRWLRGWVHQNVVQTEYDSIKRFKETSNSCTDCRKSDTKCEHLCAQTISEAIKELIRQRTLKPFFILLVMGTVAFSCGTHHLIAYMVQILNTYRSPISPNWATVCWLLCFFFLITPLQCDSHSNYIHTQVIVASTGLGGTFAGIVGLKLLGKRKLFLIALSGVVFSSLILCRFK